MPIDLTVVALRWLQVSAAVVALGLPFFQTYAPDARPTGASTRVAVFAGLALAAGAVGGLLAQTAMMAGGWAAGLDAAAIGYVIQSTGLGMAHIARAALAVVGSALLAFGRSPTVTRTLAVLAFAGATASFAWSGHGAASGGAFGWVHLIADIVHALGAALWLGALAGFCLMLLRVSRTPSDTLARSLAGFANIGTAAVVALVITGLINTAFLVGSDGVARIATSTWGLLLLAKLALFGLMLGLAAHNRFTLTPALADAVARGAPAPPLTRLRISIGVELAAGVALLGLVAAMGVQAPPASM
ncbi:MULTISPECIES: copper homeostasis membrane protein CopD [Brevundimonas]|uniref:copper homeostasis membrane protein CopD n=1 Tax=Brevundimonas TaxID=41275 RepID=UPI000F022B95|nr:copper homeostasis membrane protein CopD [Brevundimonas lutea]